jgi:large subunit ribosomal protein L3
VVQARQAEAGVGIFGTKAGMMTYFTEEGAAVPATVIALEEGNVVTMVKTQATDGYDAVQVGYKVVPERKVRKPELGHLKKAGCQPMKHLREFKVRTAAAAGCAAAAATAAAPASACLLAILCQQTTAMAQ